MKQPDRKSVHTLFNAIISGESPEEQVAILKDIIVDEFCFMGFMDEKSITDEVLAADIRERMKDPMKNKILCIKDVREKTGCGLGEAKVYVEAFQIGLPNYGQIPNLNVTDFNKTKLTDQFLEQLAVRLNKLAERWKVPEPF